MPKFSVTWHCGSTSLPMFIDEVRSAVIAPSALRSVEDPGHQSVPRLVELARLKVLGVPLDAEGFDVAAARRLAPAVAAVYLHPNQQFPLGITTSARRRDELLAWAEETGAWIIEGDYFGEIVHERVALPSLQRRDTHERVLHVGTFTSIMFPALRRAYLVVPTRLVPVFKAVRGLLGDHTETASQVALAAFLDSGAMSEHLRTLRSVLGQRHDRLLQVLAQVLPAAARDCCAPRRAVSWRGVAATYATWRDTLRPCCRSGAVAPSRQCCRSDAGDAAASDAAEPPLPLPLVCGSWNLDL